MADSVGAYGMDDPARYVRIKFSEPPAAGKSYRVGHYKYSTSTPAANEVYVEAGQVNSLECYASSGDEGVKATVSLRNGKRIITIPEFTALSRYDSKKSMTKISVREVLLERR